MLLPAPIPHDPKQPGMKAAAGRVSRRAAPTRPGCCRTVTRNGLRVGIPSRHGNRWHGGQHEKRRVARPCTRSQGLPGPPPGGLGPPGPRLEHGQARPEPGAHAVGDRRRPPRTAVAAKRRAGPRTQPPLGELSARASVGAGLNAEQRCREPAMTPDAGPAMMTVSAGGMGAREVTRAVLRVRADVPLVRRARVDRFMVGVAGGPLGDRRRLIRRNDSVRRRRAHRRPATPRARPPSSWCGAARLDRRENSRGWLGRTPASRSGEGKSPDEHTRRITAVRRRRAV
jgi:hypothetical protein